MSCLLALHNKHLWKSSKMWNQFTPQSKVVMTNDAVVKGKKQNNNNTYETKFSNNSVKRTRHYQSIFNSCNLEQKRIEPAISLYHQLLHCKCKLKVSDNRNTAAYTVNGCLTWPKSKWLTTAHMTPHHWSSVSNTQNNDVDAQYNALLCHGYEAVLKIMKYSTTQIINSMITVIGFEHSSHI